MQFLCQINYAVELITRRDCEMHCSNLKLTVILMTMKNIQLAIIYIEFTGIDFTLSFNHTHNHNYYCSQIKQTYCPYKKDIITELKELKRTNTVASVIDSNIAKCCCVLYTYFAPYMYW